MNKIDLVFYLSVLGMIWTKVGDQIHALVSSTTYSWLAIIFGAIAVVTFAFYEKINGTTPTPPSP